VDWEDPRKVRAYLRRRPDDPDCSDTNPADLTTRSDFRTLVAARRFAENRPAYAAVGERTDIERIELGVDAWRWEEDQRGFWSCGSWQD
jgi:hypothetical protein